MCYAKGILTVQWMRHFSLIQKSSIGIRHLVCPNDPRFVARIQVISRFLKHYRFIMPCLCSVLMCSQPKLRRVFRIDIHRLCSKSRMLSVLSVAIRRYSQCCQLNLKCMLMLNLKRVNSCQLDGRELILGTSQLNYNTALNRPVNKWFFSLAGVQSSGFPSDTSFIYLPSRRIPRVSRHFASLIKIPDIHKRLLW